MLSRNSEELWSTFPNSPLEQMIAKVAPLSKTQAAILKIQTPHLLKMKLKNQYQSQKHQQNQKKCVKRTDSIPEDQQFVMDCGSTIAPSFQRIMAGLTTTTTHTTE
jgi:hypothetical protein